MPLYRPPLLLRSQDDRSTATEVGNALEGLTTDYFYTGRRPGKSDNLELDVCTLIIYADENIFFRSCHYSGQKHTWKEVIKNQLKKHLKEIGVEEGIANSETRYFEVSKDNYFLVEKFEMKVIDIIAKINRSKEK